MRSRRMYEDDDEDMQWDGSAEGVQMSDDDYESSEDLPYQYDPRAHSGGRGAGYPSSNNGYPPSHSSHSSQAPGKSVLHGAFSGYSGNGENAQATIERMKMEMAGLRRQSNDAVSASLRLSDQLSATNEDAARARAALKVAETMLEEEARRRIQAEKAVEEETRRRRAAEDTLRAYQTQGQNQRIPQSYAPPR